MMKVMIFAAMMLMAGCAGSGVEQDLRAYCAGSGGGFTAPMQRACEQLNQ